MLLSYGNIFRRLMGYDKFCSTSKIWVQIRIGNFDARIRRLVYGLYQRLMFPNKSFCSCIMNSSVWLSADFYRNYKCYISEKVFKHVLLFYCFLIHSVLCSTVPWNICSYLLTQFVILYRFQIIIIFIINFINFFIIIIITIVVIIIIVIVNINNVKKRNTKAFSGL